MKVRILSKVIPVLFMIIVSIGIIFTADNIKEKNIQEKNNLDETEKVFDFWYTEKSYLPYLEYVGGEFEKETGIKVRFSYHQTINYLDSISDESENGNGPDLYIMSSENLQNSVLLGLTETNQSKGFYEEKFGENAVNALTYLGKMYGYPMGFDTSIMLYNKKYVEKVPKTFDELIEFANNFNDSGSEDVISEIDYSEVSSVIKWDVTNIMYNYGFLGNYINVCGEYGDEPSIIDVKNEKSIEAGMYYNKLGQYFYINSDSDTADSILKEFLKGKIIYTFITTDLIKEFSEGEVSCGYSVIPDMSESLEYAPIALTDVLMVNPFGDQKEDARKLAEMLSFDYAGEMYSKCGVISACDIVYGEDYLNIFLDTYKRAKSLPKLMTTTDFWMKITNLTEKIWIGEDVEDQLDSLSKELFIQIN